MQALIRFNSRVILVLGATGRIGQRVVDRLLAAGAPVRVFARPTSMIPERWRAEVARGDLTDPRSIAAAARGCSTVFLLSAMHPNLDVSEKAAISAAVSAGVHDVVKMSTTAPAIDSPISWWRAHWLAEQHLRAAPVGWTILRPNGIAMFLMDFAPEIAATRTFHTAAGAGAMALIHPDDVAEAAVSVLTDAPGHRGTTRDLTGPRAVSYDDIAVILSTILGTPVTHRTEPPSLALLRLRQQGLLPWEAEGVVANWTMTRDGAGNFARVTGDVEFLTGRPPRAVDAFLADHAADFVARRHRAQHGSAAVAEHG